MKSNLTNNLALKIVSILFAVVLWALVVNVDDPVETQSYKGIPVSVEHEEVVTNTGKIYQIIEDTDTVNVSISAKRSILEKISTSDIKAVADFKNLELNSMVPITITLPMYSGRYVSAQADPHNLQIHIEDMKKNKFPITVSTTGSVRDGYVLGDLAANPEAIEVSGPESIVNNIDKVVANVNVSGLSKDATLSADLMMYDENGGVIDQSLLNNNLGENGTSVDVKLLQTKSMGLQFDTSNVTTEAGYSISDVTYEPQKIVVSAKEKLIKRLDRLYIPASAIHASNISSKTEIVVDISPYLPEGVSLVDETATSVVVTISVEKEGTKSLDIPVGAIVIQNAPTGLKATYGTRQEISVQFTGSAKNLERLTSDKVTLYVDMKDVKKAGKYTKKIQAEAPKGCTLAPGTEIQITMENN